MEEPKLNEILDEIKKNAEKPELIKNNKFYFSYKNTWYRIRMPNQRELTEAGQCRNKVRIQLAQKGKKEGFLFKKDLIAVLKENGIDIEAMDKKIEQLKKDYVQLLHTASKKKDEEEKILAKLEEQANEIDKKMREISNEKAEHMYPAIEYQAEDAWYKFLVACCTEKAKDDKQEEWIKVWSTFEKFQQDDSDLPYIAEASLSNLLRNG